ncbi:polysaccharide deacetylase [Natranaerovirga hydrolytica]|uniref:Polysaccharide deacetylase n=1 Tax=Natranaerovirga hydrolytica TaxID=680378 RepID=A0A4R1MIE1_9FIRM|nr:polysaccharide deacetylase family protein [Natranaerovirga hydrolytica]TCK92396.1 polysaccharide deacetylase [Natranaerovirga hydrolytica]
MKKIIILIMILTFVGCTDNVENQDNIPDDNRDDPITRDINEDEELQDLEDNGEEKETEDNEEKIVEIDYQEVRPNELGHIMVVMYHGIMDNPPYHRTVDDFMKDLQYMYDNGYRLITMSDYVDHRIDVEAGYTPIVLTFDDGLESTFSLVEENGEWVPAPNTAIALIEEFAEENPDFGKAATLYINSDLQTFPGEATVEESIKWLDENGYEVANHTSQHANLSQLGAEALEEHIGKTDVFIKDILGKDYRVDTLTYPFGVRPSSELMHLVEKGHYNGQDYVYTIGFREGPSGPFFPSNHIDFSPFNVPRVRGSEGDIQDLWWFFEHYENNPHQRYISDGNKERISILESQEHLLNEEAIGEKEVYTYTIEE